MKTTLRRLAAVAMLLLPFLLGGQSAAAAGTGFTTLDVDGDQVQTYRDAYGVPHIFAATNRGLFEAFGYSVAQDRLWQLEVNRRSARGRLAEIFGPAMVTADRNALTFGYTDTELDAQFASLNAEEQGIFSAYADGINRYLDEMVAPDPVHRLPFEFHSLGLGVPAHWTVRDMVAFAAFRIGRSFSAGGTERGNQNLLQSLISNWGSEAGLGIFNDVKWLDDPDTPVSVPVQGAIGKRQKPPPPAPAQLVGAAATDTTPTDADAEAIWASLGISTRLGSHGWVASPAKSTNGSAMLFGGPGLGFTTPADVYEVQLAGGNGFHVAGVSTPGTPGVFAGRTDHIAWTVMTSGADLEDTYAEIPCSAGAGYVFQGVCTPFDSRTQTILVKGGSPVTFTIQFSVHGPVGGVDATSGVRFSRKQVQWHRELETAHAFLAFNRAHNLDEFEAAIRQSPGSFHVVYADKSGNIGYWMAGQVPVRPAGFDTRLPLPGDGSAEWPGQLLPVPTSINPTRGWLANWNNRPSAGYPAFEGQGPVGGKYNRLLEVEDHLNAPGTLTLQQMEDIAEDVAGADQSPTPPSPNQGRESRFLKPYLLAALDRVPPTNPLAPQAKAVLEAWNGDAFADAVTSTTLDAGEVIFSRWLSVNNTFADELGANKALASVNMLIHVLDDALGGGSGVPPSRDYFNGLDPNRVISTAFDQALDALGPDPAAWSAQPRATIAFRPVFSPPIPEAGSMLGSSHMTYLQGIILSRPTITSENILTLGQSGFIGLGPSGAPEFDLTSVTSSSGTARSSTSPCTYI
jgi:penicillin amidase